jgi:hypothetical protein
MRLVTSTVLIWAALAGGCRQAGVRAVPLATSVQRPSQIAFYVDVSSGGEPVAGLTSASFAVSEDGENLEPGAVQLTLLDPSLVAETLVVILVDVTAKDDAEGATLAEAVGRFVTETRTQPVAVYVYDGNEEILEVGRFDRGASPATASTEPTPEGERGADGQGATAEPPVMDALVKAMTPDLSRNMHGALLQGLEVLDEALAGSDKPVRTGTLVVIASGPDTAHRVPEERVSLALERTAHRVYGVGTESAPLERLTNSGVFRSDPGRTVAEALPAAGERVRSAQGSRYLLAYCSPARSGRRVARVEVTVSAERRSGSGGFEVPFRADGFSDDCDVKAPPRFVVTLLHDEDGPLPAAPPAEAASSAVAEPEATPARPGRKGPPGRGRGGGPPGTARPKAPPGPARGAPAPAGPSPAKPAPPPTSDGFEP